MYSSLRLSPRRGHLASPSPLAISANTGDPGFGSDQHLRKNDCPGTPQTKRVSKWGLERALCPPIGLGNRASSAPPPLQHAPSSPTPPPLPPPPAPQRPAPTSSRRVRLAVSRDPSGGLGVTLRDAGDGALIVTHVRPGGAADRDGTLRPGDRLLAVDDAVLPVGDLAAAQAALLRDSGPSSAAVLTVEYDVAMRHGGPLRVQLPRAPPHRLGLSFAAGSSEALVIGDVRPASAADRCGLRRGDRIVAVDGVAIGAHGGPTTMSLLRPSPFPLQLDILPAHYQMQAPPPPDVEGLNRHETLRVLLRHDPEFGYGLQTRGAHDGSVVITSISSGGPADRVCCLQTGDRILTIDELPVDAERAAQLFSVIGPPRTLQVSFSVAESVVLTSGVFAVKLAKRGIGLGITITGEVSAQLSGRFRFCRYAMFHLPQALRVEAMQLRDVCGANPARLLLAGSIFLFRKTGEGFVISNIKRGSVAYRCGTLAVGDRLLAVDGLPLSGRVLQEAADVLQACGDIVTLLVLKEDAPSEAGSGWSSSAGGWGWTGGMTVEYTVKLVRNGGPLGLTIAGSEDPSDLITISGLIEGGLAESSCALQVGDRLLAINGQSLHGLRLSEAIALIQSSPDVVVLRLSRCPPPLSREDNTIHPGTNIPSVDSAVESWDSHPSEHTAVESRGADASRVRRSGSCPSLECRPQSDLDWDPSLDDLDSAAATAAAATITNHSVCTTNRNHQLPVPGSWSDRPPRLSVYRALSLDWQQQNQRNRLPWQGSLDQVNDFREVRHYNDFSELSIALQNNDDLSPYGDQINDQNDPEVYPRRPMQVFQVTLYKDPVYEDFGFSVSDGLYEKGVFINRIRPGGPAELSDILRSYDRIIQVNETRTYDFDCCLTVPLIASAGDRIHLTVARHPSVSVPDNPYLAWLEEDMQQSSTTITHTI